jgi:predicted nucleic acid-binding protein
MRIYLDVSCLNRPLDDQSQERVRIEAEAVALILERCDSGAWRHVSSEMAMVEIAANPDADKRRKARRLLPLRRDILVIDDAVLLRGKVLVGFGFTVGDAVHIAAAETLRAAALLTCDDRLIRSARRLRRHLRVEVRNPVDWLREHTDADNA